MIMILPMMQKYTKIFGIFKSDFYICGVEYVRTL